MRKSLFRLSRSAPRPYLAPAVILAQATAQHERRRLVRFAIAVLLVAAWAWGAAYSSCDTDACLAERHGDACMDLPADHPDYCEEK